MKQTGSTPNIAKYHSTLAVNPPSTTIRDYVYSSEAKIRDNYTLKNLLAVDPASPFQRQNGGLDSRNFQSQQSARLYNTNSRPNTMYGQRARLLLQDENKKAKIQTEIKIKRHQSSHTKALNRCSSGSQFKQNTQEEKIKMKKALGKLNLLAEGVDLGITQQEELETVFHFLECLSEMNNHYQDAFSYITVKLKQIVFADKTSQFGGRVKNLVESKKNNQILFNFVYRSLGKTPFSNLAEELVKEAHLTLEELQKYKTKEQQGEQNYELVIKEKQEIIKKLKKELKYYQEHPSQDMYPYIKKLEQENGQMEVEIEELVRIKDEYQYRIQIYENTNMLLSEQIETLKEKIYQFELEELSGMKEIEKNSELKEFEDNLSNLRAMMDKSRLKMEGMKEQFDKVKAYNEELLNERSKLAKRAAVGFAELTPRPNMKEIFAKNDLPFEKYFTALAKNERSTEDMVKVLVETLKRKPTPSQEKKKPEKHKKEAIQDEDGFGDEAMRDAFQQIQETQNHIDKTHEAAEQVKKAYNKQQKQREHLQKVRK